MDRPPTDFGLRSWLDDWPVKSIHVRKVRTLFTFCSSAPWVKDTRNLFCYFTRLKNYNFFFYLAKLRNGQVKKSGTYVVMEGREWSTAAAAVAARPNMTMRRLHLLVIMKMK